MWEVTSGSGSGSGATIEVNGQIKPTTVGAPFKDTVIKVAQDYGLGKFRMFLNDVETQPSAAPQLIADGMVIRLVPYDVAG